jgi:PmbA protein
MLGEKEARKLCQKILKRCGKDPAEVLVFGNDDALTRFANNVIHQNVAERNGMLLVRYFIGQRIGTATTNRFEPAALDELVERARANAAASPEDPNYPGLPEPAKYARLETFDGPTAEFSPEARARAVAPICKLAAEKGLNASGAFSTGYDELAVANTQGVFAYHTSTTTDFQTVVMGEDSSGRAQASGWRVGDISPEELGREAIHKAERGRNPRKIEPGEYAVVFDPYVTEDLLGVLNMSGMGAQSVLEGRSWMNDRIGQKVMSDLVSIWDDGLDPQGAPMPFDFEGVAKQRVDLVKEGVVLGPVYDRYTGKKAGQASTGHALPPTARGFGPIASNLFMGSGQASTEEMIHSTDKGLYITRFWYTRVVHPRDCIVTGMTRDGVFMIENGQLTYPVKNLRFTQSYVEAMANVETVGREVRLLSQEFMGSKMRVPALKIGKFNFTGSTV